MQIPAIQTNVNARDHFMGLRALLTQTKAIGEIRRTAARSIYGVWKSCFQYSKQPTPKGLIGLLPISGQEMPFLIPVNGTALKIVVQRWCGWEIMPLALESLPRGALY